VPAIASFPDLLRLLVIPFFGYVAWRDIATRRVHNRTWIPLAVLAVVLLVWEFYVVMTGDVAAFQQRRFYIQVGISLGFIIPLTYLFWLIGGFGGADAKAFFIIAVLFPTYPDYALAELGVGGALGSLPVIQTTVGIFSLTILSNTVLAGAAYPLLLAGKNALTGYISPGMIVAKPIQAEDATEEYGTLLDFPDRRFIDNLSLSGISEYFAWRRLDLDALRMYLRWRGLTLADLRGDPTRYRDPATLPADPNPPGDGMIETDGGESLDADSPAAETDRADPAYDDPWGAEAFLDDIDGSAYGTTPDGLREGLNTLSAEDVVWISPGIPFLVPIFLGLVVSFTYGDLLFVFLEAIGLA
jgi:preflagellin peptidase FlaK